MHDTRCAERMFFKKKRTLLFPQSQSDDKNKAASDRSKPIMCVSVSSYISTYSFIHCFYKDFEHRSTNNIGSGS